jgi:hypothetical protein
LCKNAVARKIDRTNLSLDRNFSDDNFSARSTLSRSEKAILLVLDRAGFLHRQGQEWSNSNQSPGVDMFCRPMGGTVPRAEVREALWAQARGSRFAAPDDLWRIAPNIAVRVICTGPPCGARVLTLTAARRGSQRASCLACRALAAWIPWLRSQALVWCVRGVQE